jgi:hypothetical protein
MRIDQSLLNEWGFYRYAGAEWLNPFEALDLACETGNQLPDIRFEFPAADYIDWTIEPGGTLGQMYAARARTLRDKYDYLLLMYSGGSDSHQMMMSFLKAGVRIDEVRTCYPMKWVEKVSGGASPLSHFGLLHEFHHAVVPGLRLLTTRSPKTKITIQDTTDAYDGDMNGWHAEHASPMRNTGGVHGLFAANFRARQERDLQRDIDRIGGNVGVVYGADKPHMRLRGREVSVSFPDHWRYGIAAIWRGCTYRPEMFYWGDLRITCKQAHVIKQALALNPNIISDVDAHRRLIYPDWHWAYQQREPLHDILLLECAGERAVSIAAERTKYYNQRYAKLSGVSITDEPAIHKRELQFLFKRESQPYRVGLIPRE